MSAVEASLQAVLAAQSALQVLSTLSLLAYQFPTAVDVQDGAAYDFIIVGGGTAGSILANRLTENRDHSVLLIEAGGDPPAETQYPGLFVFSQNSTEDWGYKTEDDTYSAQNNRNPYVVTSSGKMLGGGSSMHHLFYIRGAPRDYDDMAAAANDSSWSYENMLPYIMKTGYINEQEILLSDTGIYHNTNGEAAVSRQTDYRLYRYLKAFGELGEKTPLDINGKDPMGFTQPMFTMKDGIRQSTANGHLSAARNRPNLHVMKNTEVTKIIINSQNQACGVEAVTSSSTITIKANKEVIVSAGAFNSPKLLMNSGIGPKEDLEALNITVVADLPVGENLQDHLSVLIMTEMNELNATRKLESKGNFPAPSFFGFAALNKSQEYPDYATMNLVFPNDPSNLLLICSSVFTQNNNVCQEMYEAATGKEAVLTVLLLSRPESRGKVSLRSADPTDTPKISTGFFSDNSDLVKQAACVEDYVRVLNTSVYQEAGAKITQLTLDNCTDLEFGSTEYWQCYVLNVMDTTFHYSSTCAMGAVTDARLRVNGVSNLRVVDASSMPNMSSGNIIAAVMAFAERAADIIKQDHACDA